MCLTYFRSLLAVAYLFVSARVAVATPPCSPLLSEELPVRATLASAGFFANLRKADHSINVQMDSLLHEAKAAATRITTGPKPCMRACKEPIIAVLFESSPHTSLVDYDESSVCQGLYQATSIRPIVYTGRLFATDNEAKEWYKDLTQGDGPDGEDLYQRCPGRCSPAYSSTIYQNQSHYVVTTSIVCGHARDKDDNQYRLRAALRWICP